MLTLYSVFLLLLAAISSFFLYMEGWLESSSWLQLNTIQIVHYVSLLRKYSVLDRNGVWLMIYYGCSLSMCLFVDLCSSNTQKMEAKLHLLSFLSSSSLELSSECSSIIARDSILTMRNQFETTNSGIKA